MSGRSRPHPTNCFERIAIGISTRSISSLPRAACSKATSQSIGSRALTPCFGISSRNLPKVFQRESARPCFTIRRCVCTGFRGTEETSERRGGATAARPPRRGGSGGRSVLAGDRISSPSVGNFVLGHQLILYIEETGNTSSRHVRQLLVHFRSDDTFQRCTSISHDDVNRGNGAKTVPR